MARALCKAGIVQREQQVPGIRRIPGIQHFDTRILRSVPGMQGVLSKKTGGGGGAWSRQRKKSPSYGIRQETGRWKSQT